MKFLKAIFDWLVLPFKNVTNGLCLYGSAKERTWWTISFSSRVLLILALVVGLPAWLLTVTLVYLVAEAVTVFWLDFCGKFAAACIMALFTGIFTAASKSADKADEAAT
jgi:zinc transporter ZupT